MFCVKILNKHYFSPLNTGPGRPKNMQILRIRIPNSDRNSTHIIQQCRGSVNISFDPDLPIRNPELWIRIRETN